MTLLEVDATATDSTACTWAVASALADEGLTRFTATFRVAFTGAVEDEGAATTATAFARVLVLALLPLPPLLLLLLLAVLLLLELVVRRLLMAAAFLFEPVAKAEARRAFTTFVEAGMSFSGVQSVHALPTMRQVLPNKEQ